MRFTSPKLSEPGGGDPQLADIAGGLLKVGISTTDITPEGPVYPAG